MAGLTQASRILITLVLWLLLVTAASADVLERVQRRGELRVGFAVGYMPFEMIDRTTGSHQRFLIPSDPRRGGQEAHFIGFDLDLARAMADELDVRLQPVNTRFTDLFQSLASGRVDVIISGMSITEQRQQRVDFSTPYLSIGQTALVSTRHADTVRSFRDLNASEFTVVSPPGTTGAEAVSRLMPKATYRAVESEQAAIRAVREGRADAFVYDSPHNTIALAMDASNSLFHLDQPFTREDLAVAIAKGNTEFLVWINAFLASLQTDGRMDGFYQHWFEDTSWFSKVR